MKFRIPLASATALGLLMGGAALANDNISVVNQLGDSNSASVTQNLGDDNSAYLRQGYMHGGTTLRGSYGASSTITQDGVNNRAGSASTPVFQWGTGNTLTIWQRGDNNSAGLTAHGVVQENSAGQTNRGRALATINQYTSGNVLGRSSQSNAQSGDSGLTSNILTLHQGSAGDAAGNASNNIVSAIFQTRYAGGTANEVSVFQDGAAGAGDNRIGSGFTGLGAQNHGIRQGGHSNLVDVDQIGTSNRIRLIAQAGADASSGGSWGTGNGNTAIVLQSGHANVIETVLQLGSNNYANLWQAGVENAASSLQQGSGNEARISQGGNDNSAASSQIGNDNYTNISQSGAGNIVLASVTGNFNGGGLLSGAAGSLAGDNGLSSGEIYQDGLGNSASLTISGSDSNQFALLQQGNGNTITGTVSGSGGNSAAVIQNGNNNNTVFTQNGGGNVVAVTQ